MLSPDHCAKRFHRERPSDANARLQQAIEGFKAFMKRAEQYADEVIRQTRRKRAKVFPKFSRQTYRLEPKSAGKEKSDP